jgi:hypothetical protein
VHFAVRLCSCAAELARGGGWSDKIAEQSERAKKGGLYIRRKLKNTLVGALRHVHLIPCRHAGEPIPGAGEPRPTIPLVRSAWFLSKLMIFCMYLVVLGGRTGPNKHQPPDCRARLSIWSTSFAVPPTQIDRHQVAIALDRDH